MRVARTLALSVALILATASSTVAQDAEPSDAAEEDPAMEEARARFRQGVALARAGNCEGALAELNASLAIVVRPNTLYNIAQCQEELHRYDLAIASYERYLEIAPEDDPERPAVVATMRALSSLLGTIGVSANVPAEVWLDDRLVGEAPGDVLVPGGRHVIELRASGHLPARREVEVAAGRRVEVDVTLEVAEEHVTIHRTTTVERPPLDVGIFATGATLTLASLGVGIGVGVHAISMANAARDRPEPRLPPDVSGIDTAAVVADVFYVSAGVFGVATVIIAFLTDFGGEPEPAGEGPEARVVPGGLEVRF
ncbi:MAG: tetratricopeptide repeat protein [Sandaracinaceae bacterium]